MAQLVQVHSIQQEDVFGLVLAQMSDSRADSLVRALLYLEKDLLIEFSMWFQLC